MNFFYEFDLGNSTRAVLTVSGSDAAALLKMNRHGRYTLYSGYADNEVVPQFYRPVMTGKGMCRIYNDTALAWVDDFIRGRYVYWTIYQDAHWISDDLYVLYSEEPLFDRVSPDSLMVAYHDGKPVEMMGAKEWEEGYRHGL